MQVEKIKPKVITYRLVLDRDDKEYTSCMWARYIFDCDNGRLNINSDAGDYSYGWGYNMNDDFMHLMGRINQHYLLNKISSRSKFNIEKSKADTIENIREYGIKYFGIKGKKHLEDIISDINNIEDCVSDETFFREVDGIVPNIDFESIAIEKDYPYGAVVVSELFEKYLQPKIKEEYGKRWKGRYGKICSRKFRKSCIEYVDIHIYKWTWITYRIHMGNLNTS